MEKIVARYDKDSKRYHKFTIEEGQDAVGTIYLPKGGQIPHEITVVLKTKNDD
ncbi:MAG: hypothetical protein ACFFCW_23840 [Candidatus Hodarchaeota archaeon]